MDTLEILATTHNLRREIKQLQAELEKHRWIPVSERLPELLIDIPHRHSNDLLLVYETLENTNTVVIGCYDEENGWVIYSSHQRPIYYQNQITHWKPIILPED